MKFVTRNETGEEMDDGQNDGRDLRSDLNGELCCLCKKNFATHLFEGAGLRCESCIRQEVAFEPTEPKEIEGSLNSIRRDLPLYYHNREGTLIKLNDLIEALYSAYELAGRAELVEAIICRPEFTKTIEKFLQGDCESEYCYSGTKDDFKKTGDKLRSVLTPFASAGAIQLVSHLRDVANGFKGNLEDRDNYIKQLIEAWPVGFEKYLPKKTFTFENSKYIRTDQIAKLIERLDSQPELLEAPSFNG